MIKQRQWKTALQSSGISADDPSLKCTFRAGMESMIWETQAKEICVVSNPAAYVHPSRTSVRSIR
jgi:hypothetical protein